MAFKAKNLEQIKLEKAGDKVEGYFISSSIEMLKFSASSEPNAVPKVVLQNSTGDAFSVLLGTTVTNDVKLLTPGAWTRITRGAEQKSRSGNRFSPWKLEQDDEKKLPAHAG